VKSYFMNCLYSIARCIDDFHVFRRYILWGVNTISKKSSTVLMIRKFTMIKRETKLTITRKLLCFQDSKVSHFVSKVSWKPLIISWKAPKLDLSLGPQNFQQVEESKIGLSKSSFERLSTYLWPVLYLVHLVKSYNYTCGIKYNYWSAITFALNQTHCTYSN